MSNLQTERAWEQFFEDNQDDLVSRYLHKRSDAYWDWAHTINLDVPYDDLNKDEQECFFEWFKHQGLVFDKFTAYAWDEFMQVGEC